MSRPGSGWINGSDTPFITIGEITHWSDHHWSIHFLAGTSKWDIPATRNDPPISFPTRNLPEVWEWYRSSGHGSYALGSSWRNGSIQPGGPLLADRYKWTYGAPRNGFIQWVTGADWWLNQPIWKNMLVKLDHFPKVRGENEKYLKPPPRGL